jgi:hypothetical protein
MSRYLIYALKDPRDGRIYYVGATAVGLRRTRRHRSPSAIRGANNPEKAAWLKSLPSRVGLPYDVEILEEFASKQELWSGDRCAEARWICALRSSGEPLTNRALGGPYIEVPPENRARGDRNGARLHPERLARGDRSGARLHPEQYPKGDEHYSRLRPELLARGERHGSKTKPGRLPSGDQHHSRRRPEATARGDKNGARTRPEKLSRGDEHYSRVRPELLMRGVGHHKAKLTDEIVKEARIRYRRGDTTSVALAAEVSISQAAMHAALTGKTWKHVT